MANKIISLIALLLIANSFQSMASPFRYGSEEVLDLCRKEVPVTNAELEELTFIDVNLSENAKCFMSCVMKKFKLIDESGAINVEAALSASESILGKGSEALEALGGIISTCNANRSGDNTCDEIVELVRCVQFSMLTDESLRAFM
ncbi:general odorant-binding protein 19d-like [Teleopsis dalmanni]|uniref:general odorant-binding protein 19d-like n=1 Tax=Teleopsis dalmanni TaxID=139649 RepID=UPI0018CF4340|nr:general odorant-binding protein 19d-like [Teleopsis dalmanni]XP_037935930.1 general odorant-binding protein 19d-like [Teleopsis dalmanni]